VFFILFVAGCSSSRKQTSVTYDIGATSDSVSVGDVVLETGDEIDIKFFDTLISTIARQFVLTEK